ncbi:MULTISPECIES: hypothetical protein [unclassified Candidatus Frackibacter]|uniref:hypothetical protein n=1 Tax=unclassified Candidatus Frackibacter TaxID=2648818 RepID=UPI00079470C1|nr:MULTISPECIES: hypothetical protein [unclassified Candidatus Frackibacter]KXS44471.1 MAG: hypothetical protein AWU54_741 [Candidatus Frackibacter sp. T328-2]SDC77909.1 hypothetical protein SAMN04515661_12440 [Candidatus Frackibacter sp. WG11]SEM90855.1 hypothetical protein SAMN04488698_12440 [Candidatus Frackibacter sp. WG12]SFL99791.1 hypothetical protein SAMN04488699_1255 [Candidatus Frackibacter sp. WG13]
MKIKLEFNNPTKSMIKPTVVDMIVRKNMTIGSLKRVLEVPGKYMAKIMVNGVERSEYYSLNPGDRVIFEPEVNYDSEDKNKEVEQPKEDDALKSEIE